MRRGGDIFEGAVDDDDFRLKPQPVNCLGQPDQTDGFGVIGVNPPPVAGFSDEDVELDDKTLEIRISSNSDSALSWIAGIYQKEAESDSGYRMDRGWNDQTEIVMTNGLANTQKYQKYEESAVFGEVTYSFSDKLDVTVGLRSLDYDYTFLEENWGLAFNGDLPRDIHEVFMPGDPFGLWDGRGRCHGGCPLVSGQSLVRSAGARLQRSGHPKP